MEAAAREPPPFPGAGIRPGSIQAWVLAARVRTLPVGAAPVLVGSAVAWASGAFDLPAALAALAGSLFIQIGANFANDLFDFQKGADTAGRLGPLRASQAGLLSERQVKAGVAVSFTLACMAGVYLITAGGWPILAVGVLSILSALAYTGGPWPFGYKGLGDLFVFIFFGPVAVCGTYFAQAGSISNAALYSSIPCGFLATAVLAVNNIRDMEADERAGKRTLPVRFGLSFGRGEYAALVGGAFLATVGLALAAKRPWLLLPLALFPESLSLSRAVLRAEPSPALNPLLARTARLLLLYSVLISLGWMIP